MKVLASSLSAAALLLATIPASALAWQAASSATQVQNQQEMPVTDALNRSVGQNIESTEAVNQANQAQYQADLAAYDAALTRAGRRVARQDARYMRQQRAYAQAMAAWRLQADACKRGKRKACNAPTPDPADYY